MARPIAKMHRARSVKDDEFYTSMPDISAEVEHYKEHFRDKALYLNCDNPNLSNFYKFFFSNFRDLGIRYLMVSWFNPNYDGLFSQKSKWIAYSGDDVEILRLYDNGDFRSEHCIDLLKYADIVCTNPPFSLFRDYISLMMKWDKKFLVLGPLFAIGYRDIFPLLKQNQIHLGVSRKSMKFKSPSGKTKKMGNVRWYTNLQYNPTLSPLVLSKKYTPEKYPKYDNYDAINVDRVKDIPYDYEGVMGVPISFMDYYDPERFNLLSVDQLLDKSFDVTGNGFSLNGKFPYRRLTISHKLTASQ